ncbi:L-threonine 3-O-phosphate decarboxylase [hydrothermal vent metagenome]|uniref:L-threonine 3-O-phosphate decarboxylase n=1 Tax=hydrothermal vent metagenome TaxID=652676 RepID=A0A1W1BY72_9ZZZZ
MKTFQHGGDILSFADEIGCQVDELVDLSSNINFVKPKIDISFNSLDISPYPNYNKLYKSISKLYSVRENQIELFNGGSSAIFSLFKLFALQDCTIYSPAYLEYKKAGQIFNYKITYINRFENIEQDIPKNSLVIFVNPSTPDGKFYNIDKLIKKWIKKRCTILIDESFLDFTDFKSATSYINCYDKLYILKSMTKFYSAAGIRVGTIISNTENIKKIKRVEPMWKISQFDSSYLQEVLKDRDFSKISKEINLANREYLYDILNRSNHIERVYPSSANYILAKLKNLTAEAFQKLLTPHKIMLRDCSNFDFLDEKYIRIAVKQKSSLELLKKVLDES